MQTYTLLVFPGRCESVVDNISESVTKHIKLPKSFERFERFRMYEFRHFSVTFPWQNVQMLLHPSLHLQIFPEIQVKCMSACIGAIWCPMIYFESSGCNLKAWVQHMYHGCQFTTPAILRHLLLVVGSLSVIYWTFSVTTWLYPEEFRKRLGDRKKYKNQIQLLCANSDPMGTIVQ